MWIDKMGEVNADLLPIALWVHLGPSSVRLQVLGSNISICIQYQRDVTRGFSLLYTMLN
jgi:hypothetical protein